MVMKANQIDWIRRDPRTSHWITVVDNRKIAFGGHRDHRLLLASQVDQIEPSRLASQGRAGSNQ